jgi:hypothetical protein
MTTSNCTRYLRWSTSYACPVSTVTGSDCGVTIPQTGTRISLLPLAALGDITVPSNDKYSYTIAICRNTSSSQCLPQGGACQITNDTWSPYPRNIGFASTNVSYSDGAVKVHYNGGDVCASTQSHRNTVVVFKCDPAAGLGSPTFLSEIKTCVYQFVWKTNLVCTGAEPIECVTTDPVSHATYDLSVLSSAQHNWVARTAP